MSNENTEPQATPNVEGLPSNVDYGEFINSVRGSEDLESMKEVTKTTGPRAEDQVVAILLSAMMGSIVQDWEVKEYPATEKHLSGDVESAYETSSPTSTEIKSPTDDASLSPQKNTVTHDLFGSQNNTALTCKTVRVDPSLHVVGSESKGNEEELSKIGGSEHTLEYTTVIENSNEETEDSIIQLDQLNKLLENEKQNIYGWEFLNSDKEFIITFKRGNRYEGKLSNCRMHGQGEFSWADGSVYTGNFHLGKMTGQGKLYWPDKSWYEGELCGGYRHGRGLFVLAPTFYAGYWRCGCRQGVGAMFYNNFDTTKNYYNGEWFRDKKHGTGLRSYPSGGMYSGQWKSGKINGLGTMVWTNRDVYSGNFNRGKMHGYGEYTWDTFFNQQLVLPEENCYYGDWANNQRHGNGTLETTTGVVVKGSWRNNKKHGPAEVACSNGSFLYADNLFEEDNLYLPESNKFDADSLNASIQSLYQLPVGAPSHDINLGYYADRLVEYVNDCSTGKIYGKPFCATTLDSPVKADTKRTFSINRSFASEESKFNFKEEETYIRNVIMQYLSTVKGIYTKYAQVCCERKLAFPGVLMRFMWWQLLRDCDLHNRGLSLADFDICIANNKACLVQGIHYPFERLLFWQFLHCLIEVSWELYVKKGIGTPSVKGFIASGLHKLITIDIIPNAGRHKGNALFNCRDLLSFDSLYWFYRGVGEPLSAREFLKRVVSPQESYSPSFLPTYQEYQVRGKNIIGVGERLTYLPKEEPLLRDKKYEDEPTHPKNLSCLSSIGLLSVLECIIRVSPSISNGELLVNMDYKIVFLEFYEILILCARIKARDDILERKKNEEDTESSRIPSPMINIIQETLTQTEEVLSSPEKSSQRKKSSVSKKTKKNK